MKIARDLVVAFLYVVLSAFVVMVLVSQNYWIASGGFMCFGLSTMCLLVWSENRGHEFFFEPMLRRRPLLGSLVLPVVVVAMFFMVINLMVVGYEAFVGHPYLGCTEYTIGFWNYF